MSRNFLWFVPVGLLLGAGLSFLQPGSWLVGWLAFSVLLLLAFYLFAILHRWAGGGQMLAWMVILTFGLRLVAGAGIYLALPVNGYDDADDRAGFLFTDAHRRDDQAWELAQSDERILSAFNKTYHTDQYGGLLAFTSLAYRYLSPDAHRPILLILLSGIVAVLGIPFFWRAARTAFGDRLALIAGWILVLYPESLLLGGAAMREPYLITFGAMCLWGFVDWQSNHSHHAWLLPLGMIWLGLGLAGMLLVSPVVALITLVILVGWWWMAREHRSLSWAILFAAAIIFLIGLFLLILALNRQGTFDSSGLGVIRDWLREAIKWDVYQLERGSGWVQKLFDEMPEWLHMPFVTIYGIFQPVLPAAFIEPTTLTWRIIGITRALGWYLFWPLLLYAFMAAWKNEETRERRLWLWITVISWLWIILTALRGGGDQWDNPRYRTILLIWQALAAAYAWTRFRARIDSWLVRIWLVEVLFLAFFTQWYLSRYYHIGGQIPFGWMVALIIGSSLVVLVGGELWDRSRSGNPAA
jgi:4-amino-4-deoxy-L-arabinose transferase-like glycosyltransferase